MNVKAGRFIDVTGRIRRAQVRENVGGGGFQLVLSPFYLYSAPTKVVEESNVGKDGLTLFAERMTDNCYCGTNCEHSVNSLKGDTGETTIYKNVKEIRNRKQCNEGSGLSEL